MVAMCINVQVRLNCYLCTVPNGDNGRLLANAQGVMLMPLGALPTETVFMTLRTFKFTTETELA